MIAFEFFKYLEWISVKGGRQMLASYFVSDPKLFSSLHFLERVLDLQRMENELRENMSVEDE